MSHDKNKGVAYDARQETTRLLVERMSKGQEFLQFADYRSSYLQYRGVFNIVASYVRESEREEIRGELEKVNNLIRKTIPLLRSGEEWSKKAGLDKTQEIENLLMHIEELLVTYARHMFLPSGDNEEEFHNINDLLSEMEERTGV